MRKAARGAMYQYAGDKFGGDITESQEGKVPGHLVSCIQV